MDERTDRLTYRQADRKTDSHTLTTNLYVENPIEQSITHGYCSQKPRQHEKTMELSD